MTSVTEEAADYCSHIAEVHRDDSGSVADPLPMPSPREEFIPEALPWEDPFAEAEDGPEGPLPPGELRPLGASRVRCTRTRPNALRTIGALLAFAAHCRMERACWTHGRQWP